MKRLLKCLRNMWINYQNQVMLLCKRHFALLEKLGLKPDDIFHIKRVQGG